jgi:hypothetical protein
MASLSGRGGARLFGRAVLTQLIQTRTPDDILEGSAAHATQIGHIVFAWNRLQERLSDLFALFTGTDERISYAIWRSLTSDRSQREILAAAANIALKDYVRPDSLTDKPSPLDDVNWLLVQADALAGARNQTIHAPYRLEMRDGALAVVMNTRAGRLLSDPDLVKEFETYRDEITALWRYAEALASVIKVKSGPRPPWPERPLLRASARSPSRRQRRRAAAAK